MKTIREEISKEIKSIKGHNVVVKTIRKTITGESSEDKPLITEYFECLINNKHVGSHEIGKRQLDYILDEKNIDDYSKI